jgi:hypothetical protein
MKMLVIWYSFSGHNALLARELGQRLSVVPVKERRFLPRTSLTLALDFFLKRKRQAKIEQIEVDPRDFDHVIFVAPLYNMWIAQPLTAAVLQLRGKLGGYSFVSFCGYRREGQTAHVRDELSKIVGRPPDHVWELRVQDLVPPADREKVRVVSRYRVTEADLSQFSAEIDAIVQTYAHGPVSAPAAVPFAGRTRDT